MAISPAVLPEDPADLRPFCEQLLAELADQQHLIDKLTHELALFRRYLYGRRSEQLTLDPAQLLLEYTSWLKALNTAATPAADPTPDVTPPPPPRRGHGRTPLPALLPRRRVEHTLPEGAACTCAGCGTALVKIGEETSEQLDYQPASLFVVEHVRFKYACPACEERVVTSPLPAQPIDKGRPGPGLLAQVITAKYADHVPLNRQVDIFAYFSPTGRDIGAASSGAAAEDADPYAGFLPAADDGGGNEEEPLRVVVIVTEGTPKGTARSAQEYAAPLLVMSGREYATLTFAALHAKVCDAVRGHRSTLVAELWGPDRRVRMFFEDGQRPRRRRRRRVSRFGTRIAAVVAPVRGPIGCWLNRCSGRGDHVAR
jgi:transposase